MRRALVGWCACFVVLVVGVLTAGLAVENRARGDELDKLQRWCEAQARRNELARVANERREWCLLGQRAPGELARVGGPQP
jgi:hypothetical protein